MKLRNGIVAGILLLLIAFTVSAQDGELLVEPDSGTYTWDQVVTLTCADGFKILYSFGGDTADPDVPYTEPFLLSAVPEEERSYSLNVALLKDDMIVERQTYEYLIDKQSPRPPFINIQEGVYNEPVAVSLQSQSEAQIVYSLGGSETTPLRVWRGEPIRLEGRGDGDAVYKISAYAVDPAGNKSRVENWGFRITTPGEQEKNFRILSPVAGNFRNRQLLYLKASGYQWIRFTTNGADPVLSGSEYSGPVLLRKSGDVELKIAAMPLTGADGPENYTVEFSAGDENLENVPESGTYSTTLGFRTTIGGLYCMDERTPVFPDPDFSGELKLYSIPQGYRTLPLRVLAEDETEAEFRYFYILDNRYPADPVILSRENSPLTAMTQITLEGSDFSSIYYSLDGSSPDLNSRAYKAPFMLNLPDDSNSGSIIIKARAFSKNGNVSAETSRLFTYNRSTPNTPVPRVEQVSGNSAAVVTVSPPASGTRVLFEMSNDPDSLKNLNRNSPVFPGEVIIDVPRGKSSLFYLVFAARDNAGNLSEPTEPLEISIDRRTSTAPLIEQQDGFIYLYGPEILYYSISNGDTGSGEEPTGIQYVNPFQLQGQEHEKTVLKVSAWVEDEEGSRGPVSEERIVIPGTVPDVPGYYGVEDGGIYNNKTVIVYITNPGENESVHYNYAMDDIPVPEINEDSPMALDNLFFTGMPGVVSRYHLVMRTRNLVTGRFSDAVEVSFTLDLEPPVLPELTGIEDGAVYSGEVYLDLPEDIEDSVFISFTYNDQSPGDPFGENGGRLFQKKRFSVPDGVSRKIFYRIGAEDIAGNRTRGEELHWFVIDNTVPGLPRVTGLPEQGLSSESVSLNLAAIVRDTTVHYEVTYDGTMPDEIGMDSPVFGPDGLYFKGVEGVKTPVILKYKTRNSAGTWGNEENLLYFIIDLMAPQERGELQFQVIEDQKKFILSWDVEANQELFFRIPELGGDFLLFNEPVTLSFPEGKDNLTVESYVTDRAGNTSGMQVKSIRFPFIREGELIGGFPETELSNSLVRLFRIEASGIIRYEITTDGEIPSNVDRFSPLFPKSMDLDAAEGEKIEYLVKVRSFSGIGAGGAGTEQLIKFTIDKTKPLAPLIEGVADGEHYQEDLILSFAEGDSNVYYALQKGFREDNPGFPDFTPYEKPILIESKEGTFDTYRIYAYRKNPAGNQSEIKEWEFFIDREIIYVSADGNDLNAGTRSRPFKTLEKAVQYSDVTGRNTVFLSGGEYEVNESLVIPEKLNIIGGFNQDSWEQSEGNVSIVRTGEFFPPERPLFLIAGEGIFRNLKIEIDSNSTSAVIQQEGGEWRLESSEILLRENAVSTPVMINSGTLTADDTVFTGEKFSGGPFILNSGGLLELTNSRLTRSDSGGESVLISALNGSEVKILSTLLSPGNARSTVAVKAEDSDIWIDEQSEIMPGQGSIDALAVYAGSSDITILNSTIECPENGRVVQGIYCEDSKVILQDSYISLSADVGAVCMQANNTAFLLMGNIIQAAAEDFVYIFRSTGSNGRIINNYLRGGETEDLKGIVTEGGSVSLFHNTITLEDGTDVTGILAGNGRELNIINNIILSDSIRVGGTAVKTGDYTVRIQGNNLHGWATVYQGDVRFSSPEELNLSDLSHAGGPFHANIDEGPEKSFTDKYDLTPHLRRNSLCINGGVDVSLHRDLLRDWDREIRPNPNDGIKPTPDIGADEYYF